MKYSQWLDIWLENYVKPTTKIKTYTITREMCYELIDRIIIGGSQSITGKEREIEIVYKIDIVSVLRHKVKK